MKAKLPSKTKQLKTYNDELKSLLLGMMSCSNPINTTSTDEFLQPNDYFFILTNHKDTRYVLALVKNNTDSLFDAYTCELRKQGTGKKTVAEKCQRIHILGISYIMASSEVKKIKNDDVKLHDFLSTLPDSDVSKALQIFKPFGIRFGAYIPDKIHKERLNELKQKRQQNPKSKILPSPETDKYTFVNRMNGFDNRLSTIFGLMKETGIIPAKEEEPVIEVQPTETPTVEPPVEEEVKEETLLDKLIEVDKATQTTVAKSFVDRLITLPFDEEILEKIKTLDNDYFYAQLACVRYNDSIKELNSIETSINEKYAAINELKSEINKLKHRLNEEMSKKKQVEEQMKKTTKVVQESYTTVNDYVTNLEELSSKEAQTKKKVEEIVSNLSKEEKDELLKALGIVPKEHTVNKDLTVVLVDGKNMHVDTSWASIKEHVIDISKKHATPNKGVFVYLAEQINKRNGLTQAELGRLFGSDYYAAKAFDFCREYKLIKAKQSKSVSSDAIKRGAETRKKASELKKSIIKQAFEEE